MSRPIPLFGRLEIETQSNCNRSCWFCPRIYDSSGVYLDAQGDAVIGQMPDETVLNVLDQAASLGFDGMVSFYFYSEPFLDKRNLDFARAARARGMKPYVHTNGDILKHDEALCRQVRDAYEKVVIGVYDYHTAEELESEKGFWRRRLSGCDLHFSTIGNGARGSAPSMGTPRALVPTDRRFPVPDLVFTNAPCHRPLIRLILRYDGEMCMCCEDLHGDFGIGNIHASTVEELWYSDRHVRMVRDLIAGRREKYNLCRRCPMSPSAQPTDGARISFTARSAVTA